MLTHWESSACCVSLISKEMSVREGTSPLLGSSWSAYQTGAFAGAGGQGRRQPLAWKGREQAGIPMADPAQGWPGISAVKGLGLPARCEQAAAPDMLG